MLNYVWRQELVPYLALDPILHYYPLMACFQEPRALATVWKSGDGAILGAVIPCDPPGTAWVLGGSARILSALLEEIPPESPVTLPFWSDGVVKEKMPGRTLSTEVIAVCTPDSLRHPASAVPVTIKGMETVPGLDATVVTAPAQVAHLGCFFNESLAGYCTYRLDGLGGGSIEKLVVGREWRNVDLGRTIVAAAASEILDRAERVIFIASGENQKQLGVVRSVGFRSCYWLRSAGPASGDRSAPASE